MQYRFKFMYMNNNVLLAYIDARLIVFGDIKSSNVCDVFGCGRIKASRLFQLYLNQRPSNMKYQASKKCYVQGYVFEPVFLGKRNARQFLDALELILEHN